MEKSTLKIGRRGEEIARNYLEEKGYKTVEQNFRNRFAEIDLVMKDKKELVFVEVRAKTNERFGTPEESLNKKKLKKVKKNALAYTAMAHWRGPFRVDAVCLVLTENGEVKRLSHHQNILV